MRPKPSTPSPSTVLEDLPFYLARASLNFRRFNDRTLRELGLPSLAPGAASVVHALAENKNCTVSSVAERTQLPNGTLSGLLDSLEVDGYLRRVENADDGRSWRLRLTARGRRLAAKLTRRHEVVMRHFSEVLSEQETAQLKDLLARLTARMRAYPAHSTSKSRRQRPDGPGSNAGLRTRE